ncbi:hypothetical protein F511_30667 [Dorcoceras hygrometricum]|uniref:CCHC-type domain-containing protein n=1 Tax=Dorcoceras hygrometricum TaxID=472368 RepID=A0A2Z7AE04_9LAMI|nr:hypothetical protein F511_30667 [Dorcoceras hygrometricum]
MSRFSTLMAKTQTPRHYEVICLPPHFPHVTLPDPLPPELTEPDELEFDHLLNCFPRGLNFWRLDAATSEEAETIVLPLIQANNSAGKSERPQHHAQPISRWKSSIRIFRSDTQSTITARWSLGVTISQTPPTMIALDLSSVTTHPADHNASLTRASIKFQAQYESRSKENRSRDKNSLAHPDLHQRPQGQQRPQQQGTSAPRPGGFPVCKECSMQHSGPCMSGSGKCFHCKVPGNISRVCPNRRQTTGHVFVMQTEAVDPDTTLLTGILF